MAATVTVMPPDSSTNTTTQKTILCVDDEPNILSVRGMILKREGYHVLTASNGPDALGLFAVMRVDAVVLDYLMPQMDGAAVATQMKQIRNSVPILLLSGCLDIPKEHLALFDGFISKGEAPTALLAAIEKLLLASANQ